MGFIEQLLFNWGAPPEPAPPPRPALQAKPSITPPQKTRSPAPLLLSLDGTPVEVTRQPHRKQAVGRFRDGKIAVTVPSRWPQAEQVQASLSLARRVLKDHHRQQQWVAQARLSQPCLTLTAENQLQQYVEGINAETFCAKLNGVQFGWAKYSRLAQINLKNNVMTVSPYCTWHVPEPALRYLIIHELAHTLEANHSTRFWRHVAQFCPDWKLQSRLIKAIHSVNVNQNTPPR